MSRAALVVIVAAGVASASAAPRLGSQEPAAAGSRRPFEHRRHEGVTCSACHGTGARHRVTLVQSQADCARCHHDERRVASCGSCHPPAQLRAPRIVHARLALTVWDSVGRRELGFRHELHLRPGTGVQCRDCHTTPVTLATRRACASCHVPHHRPEAACTSCHVTPREGVHQAAVHLGCAGAGCHAPSVAPAPARSRTTCLACHPGQADHEPAGSCASCHVPAPPPPSGESGAGAGIGSSAVMP